MIMAPCTGAQLAEQTYWLQNVETLQFYTGFIAMQATPGSACNANTT